MIKHILLGLAVAFSTQAYAQDNKEYGKVLEAECRVILEARKMQSSSVEPQFVDGYYYQCELLIDIRGDEYVYLHLAEEKVVVGQVLDLSVDINGYSQVSTH